ncbi:MAG: hypothetical protein GY943_35125 [Chloroflexi bacterium]|nr:hypothetical protein [Chloroflexota bacterium]
MKLKRPRKKSYPGASKQEPLRQRRILQIIGFLISAAFIPLAIIFYLNPFIDLALEQAAVAQSEFEQPELPSIQADTTWCLGGDFLAEDAGAVPMRDDGASGDKIAADNIHSSLIQISEPGEYYWVVFACEDDSIQFPTAGAAWATTQEPDQSVRFTLDTNQYHDGFYPSSYIVNAQDSSRFFVAVGDLQEWDSENPASLMQPAGNGRLQHIFNAENPGVYTGVVMVKDTWNGYMAQGRSDEMGAFEFTVSHPGERVVYLFDPQTGRSSIRHAIPYNIDQLAFGGAARKLSYLFVGVGVVTAVAQAWYWLRHHPTWQLKAGCPECQQYQLRRSRRENKELLLNMFGFPVRHYVCKVCGWHGSRFP